MAPGYNALSLPTLIKALILGKNTRKNEYLHTIIKLP